MVHGSGAIGISIKKEFPEPKIEISLLDISLKALEIAKKNANALQVHIKEYILSNMFENVEKKYDIIVSNPPYIETQEISKLEKEVQAEPILALDGGKDGLQYYRVLIEKAPLYLKEKGYLCLEIGYSQKEAIKKLIEEQKKYKEVMEKKDLSGNDRVIIAKIK